MKRSIYFLFILFMSISNITFAKDKIELKTIKIKGNKELPKILYLVPWQESKNRKQTEQKLKLHDFFGDIYEPLSAEPPRIGLKDNN